MTDNALSTTLAAFLISPVELILIFLALIVVPGTIIAIVFLVLWLVRRSRKPSPAPIAPPSPPPRSSTKRFCPQCGKEMSPDAPQGLCPSCLMQVALGTQSGDAPKRDSPKAPPPAPSELAARFPQLEILELLGQGGMGAVYKARQKNLDRLVALKVLPAQSASDPGFTERFNREARALAKLSHPNIVGVYEYGQNDGIPYFIMEYVDGVNLRQLQQANKLAPREALQIIPQICEALQFAHDEGIVHRDIKPENVLLDKKGRAKIADFGLARILGREPSVFRLTGARDIMGTPHYMAPEQIEKPQTVDHRADIYSLGVVFYEMLTGELPLGRFAPPSEKVQVDVRLDEVVLKTLEKEPSRRYQHAGEIKTRLDTIASQPGVTTTPAQPSSSRTIFGIPFVRGATFAALIIGVVILGLAAAAIWATWEAIKRPAEQRQQAARATLQLSLADQIQTRLAAQQVHFSDIHFSYDAESPRIRVIFSGLRSSRDSAEGLRDINGELLLQFYTPEACSVTGSGDLSFFKDRLKVTNSGFIWWRQEKGEPSPGTPKLPYELGPIVERTVTRAEVNSDGLAFVNFEKTEVMPSPFTLQVDVTTPEILVHNSRIDEWIAASSLDLALHLKETNWAWAPLGVRTLFVEDEASFQLENVNLEQAERALTDTKARKGTYVVHGAGMSAYPITVRYLFKTREGTAGLVELVGFTNGVNGVKMRYRLAQPVVAQPQTSVVPDLFKPAELEFRLVAAEGDTNTPADELADPNDRTGQTKLRVLKEVLLDSRSVSSANLETNVPPGAGTTISVRLNNAHKLERITTPNLGRRLAIVWRGRVLSAPVIRTPITGSAISINGNLSEAEANVLVSLMNFEPKRVGTN